MKSCPTCKRTFDDTLTFCLVDGSILSAPFDPQVTQHLPASNRIDTPTEVIHEIPNRASLPPTKQKNTSALPTIISSQPVQPPQTIIQGVGRQHTSNRLIWIVSSFIAVLTIGIIAVTLANRNLRPTENVNINTNTTSNNNVQIATNTNSASKTGSASNSRPAAQEGGEQDFTLVNQTGVAIYKVFISPHDSDNWQENILDQDTLPNGQSVEIKFHRTEKAAMWDLRVEDKQGNSIEWENLNLLEISKVTLVFKAGKGTAQVE